MNAPRIAALRHNESTYHGKPCSKCGRRRRWTGSGFCYHCKYKKRGSIRQAMRELFPGGLDLLEAIARGLPMYKLNEVCEWGHPPDWRYVTGPHDCRECGIERYLYR